ncbi:MAG: GNAT family N-acetyltransferase [Chitinophagaceae bacterium]|nr:GNAT family N-acetyltransferase [Chitinophagaceae bacterium]
MKIILETERLYLRQFTLADAQLLVDLNGNPEVTKYLHEQPTTLNIAQQVIEQIILPQYTLYNHGRLAVHVKSNNEFIGWCGLKYLKERNKVDLGYRFFQQHWGKGYATETAQACIDYGFNNLNINHIMAMALWKTWAHKMLS